MADRLDILLGILLDKAAQKDVVKGLSEVEKGIEGVDKATKGSVKAQAELLGMSEDFVAANQNNLELLAQMGGVAKEELMQAGQAAKIAAQAAKEIISKQDLEKFTDQAQKIKQNFSVAQTEVTRLTRAASGLQQIFTPLLVGGTALVGAISLSATQYVKFIESSGIKGDETAERWIAASKRVKNAQLNLGEASAQVLLPVYEQAAALAEKAAAFVQNNPDLVRAALNTGLVVATLGAVGVAVSKGIKLYADFKYLAATVQYDLATRRFETSVREYLTGTLLGGKGAGATKTAASLSGLPTAAIVAGAGLYAGIGRFASNVGAQAFGTTPQKWWEDTINYEKQAIAVWTHDFGEFFGKGDEWFQKVGTALGLLEKSSDDASQSTESLASGIRDFQKEAALAQATQSYIQYRQQEAQAEKQYMEQRADIVKQGAAQLAQIESNYQKQRTDLIRQFTQSSAQAISNFNFQQKQAEEQFAFSEAQAIADHNKQRVEQVNKFQEDEKRSREDHLRAMRKLQDEHNDRIAELTAARDALGLVKENRDFARKQRDANEEYSVEKKRRRQDFNQRQRDEEEQFQQERARRRQEFEFRQQQAVEEFARQQAQAKAQYEERLKQLDEQHRQELAQARQQTAEKLRDLQLQYRQEQIARRNAFFDILRDLDANLLNEQNIRNQYYARMQADLIRFLDTTASAIGGAGSNLPGYQHGGYTPDGAIRAHRGEWIANRETTQMLERLVGGRLTQDAVRSLAMGNSVSTVNLAFPGGLVTAKVVADMLDERDSKIIRTVTKGLVG